MRIICTLLILISSAVSGQENTQLLDYLERALDSDSAQYYFRKASELKNGNKQETIFHYYRLLHFKSQRDLDSAEWHGLQGLSLVDAEEEPEYSRRLRHQLMMINRDKGLLDKALEHCLKAYEIVFFQKDTAQIARYLTERAFIHHDFEQFQLGIASGKEALKFWKDHSERIDLHRVYILNAIAINFDDWNKPDSALSYYERILSIESMKGSPTLASIYNNQGNTLLKQERFEEAYSSLMKSYKIQKGGKGDYYFYDMATVLNNLGIIQSRFDVMDSARFYLDMAETYADSSNSFEKKRDSYFAQFEFAEKTGNLKRALDYQSRYFGIRDSIFQEERAAVIAQMETAYQTEQKEHQIALQQAQLDEKDATLERNRIVIVASVVALILLVVIGLLIRNRLKKKQQILIQQERLQAKEAEINATISSQEKERARYARDLHDGFGQMISILNMNLGNLKSDSKPNERQKVFEESEKVVNEMYAELKGICFDLMPQTLVQEGLQSGLTEFAERINKTDKVFVETNFFGLEKRLSEVQEISLYRITQEWINNVLKYGDADKITLQITKDDQEITLLIEDNGSGFDKSTLTNSKGNGWKNLHVRTNLIQGKLDLETQPGKNGTTLIVNASAIQVEKTEPQENSKSLV